MLLTAEDILNHKKYELIRKKSMDFLNRRYPDDEIKDPIIEYHFENIRKTKELMLNNPNLFRINDCYEVKAVKANFINSLLVNYNNYFKNGTPSKIKKESLARSISIELATYDLKKDISEEDFESFIETPDYAKLFSDLYLKNIDCNTSLHLPFSDIIEKNNLCCENVINSLSLRSIKEYLSSITGVIDEIWNFEKQLVFDTSEEWAAIINLNLEEYGYSLIFKDDELRAFKVDYIKDTEIKEEIGSNKDNDYLRMFV